jgi:ZIP family zinc transporter/zinc and cadmium transporter
MNSALTLSIILGATAAAANGFGGAVLLHRDWERRYLRYFIALGSGFMLAVALKEMLPESLRLNVRWGPVLILAGYLIIHFFEHTVAPHFHFGEETHHDEFVHAHRSYSVVLGLLIHTFFDGIAITSGFLVSPRLGWLIFLAVFLHKLPEGFAVASVMLAGGRSRRAALGAATLLGLGTLLGVLVMGVLRSGLTAGLPLAAGVTIYVAATDLVPEVNREPGGRMALVVFAGVALFMALDSLLPN